MNDRPALARPIGAGLLAAALGLGGCASAPPPPPKQILEYERHTAVGLEKHAHGYLAQARGAFQRALTHAELDDSAERIASALINLGGIDLLLDAPESAGRAYGRAVREARAAQDATLEWQAQNGLAEATRRLGQAAKALELYAARPVPAKAPGEALVLAADVGRALALADAGRRGEALDLLERTDAAIRKLPQAAPTAATAQHARARILLAAGRPDDALAAARAALDLDRGLHHPPSVADDHRLIGDILAALGRAPEAAEHRARAATIFSRTGQTSRLAAVQATPARP